MVTYQPIYDLIQSHTGLLLNAHQRSDVAAALDSIAASDAAQYGDLLSRLSEFPLTHSLWQRIVHAITVGETYFFRNQAQFDALRSHILPTLIEERRKTGNKQIRLWSAGSATGEEPYSLAILLREMLPDIETWSITLLATDINEAYLEQARRGLYRARSFRNETPDGLRDRWFVAEQDGYRLVSSIRNMVIFKPLNLVSDDYPAFENSTMYMDVIFCRNVTIYFDRETTRQVAGRFHRALSDNGWLVVGHSEPQSEVYQGFTARNFKDTVLYQKVEAETPPNGDTAFKLILPAAAPPRGLPRSRNREARHLMAAAKPFPVSPSPQDFWAQAKAAADLEKWDEAREWLDKAERKDPFRPEVHYLRALIELHGGNIEQGLQLLRRAVYCDANFALAHYMLGDLYNKQGANKEAMRHWQLALSAAEHHDSQQILPYSDDLTVEMLVELLATRL